MVKLVNTAALKAAGETLAGSTPAERTIYPYWDGNDEHDTSKPCKRCGLYITKEGHDPCLGTLPGVKFACCGHGGHGYIYFENGIVVRFPALWEIQQVDTSPTKTLVQDYSISRLPGDK